MERPPLSMGHNAVTGLHVLFAVVFGVFGLIDTSGGDGFADLARFALLLMAGLYLLAVATVAAVARYATSVSAIRYALIALGPPVLTVIAILFIRGA